MKKIIALMLVVLMLGASLTSCLLPGVSDGTTAGDTTTGDPNNGEEPGGETTPGDGEDETTPGGDETTTGSNANALPPAEDGCNLPELSEVSLSIIKDKKVSYKIIYAAEMPANYGTYTGTNTYKDIAQELAGKFTTYFGVTVSVSSDQDSKANARYLEILIGPTNREESDKAMMFCNGGKGFIVKAVNKKLVINGFTADKTREAMNYFGDNFVSKGGKDLTFTSADDYASTPSYNGASNKIAGYSYGTYTIVVPENPDYSAIRTAKRIQILIANRIGTIPAIVYDTDKGHNKDFEILVGATNRTSDATKNVGKLEYVIAMNKATVEINAGSSWAFEYAAEFAEKSLVSELNNAKYDEGELVRTDIQKSLEKDGTKVAAEKSGELRLVVQNVWGWSENANMGIWGCAPEHYNSAAQRNLAMAELYIDLDADVIALQEYTPRLLRNNVNHDISPILEAAGYAQVYQANGVTNSCTPIFYKTDKFELLESKVINLIERYGGQVGGDKYITIAVLKHKADGNVFGVISIHKAYQGDAQADSDRYNMALDAVAEADAIREKYGDCPVFVGGDFNCVAGSKPYNVYTSSGFASAVQRAGETDTGRSYLGGPTWNATKSMFITDFSGQSMGSSSESIDHIMVKGNTAGLVRYDILTDVVSASISDHLCQVLDFNLN